MKLRREPIGDPRRRDPACLCPACSAARNRRSGVSWTQAVMRAEELLRRFLTPEQIADWEEHGSVVVTGSVGSRFRLTPGWAPAHKSVVRQDGLGISVWPVGLDIQADWLLAMTLELQANEKRVVDTGCHGWVFVG